MRLIDADAFMRHVAGFAIDNPDHLTEEEALRIVLLVKAEAELYGIDLNEDTNQDDKQYQA